MKQTCCSILFLIFSTFIISAEPSEFVYQGITKDIQGKYIGIFEDVAGALSIDEIRNLDDFKIQDQIVPNLNISKSTFWAKVIVRNESDEEDLLVEYDYPIVSVADMYILSPDGDILKQVSGSNVSIYDRKYEYSEFIYDLHIPKNESRTIFLKIQNDQQIMLPLKIGTKNSLYIGLTHKYILLSIYTGIIAVMFIYNLFLFFATRDKSYFFYSIYILLLGLTHISIHGFSYKLLWPSSPMIAEWSVALSPAVVGIASIFFIRSFLQTGIYARRIDKFYNYILLVYVACIILYFAGFGQVSYKLSQGIVLVLAITIMASCVTVIRKGYHPAKYFMLAWTIFVAFVVVFILKDFGIFPYNTFTIHCMEVGASIELVLISFALADRINIMKREKVESQAKALETLKENERIVREQNVVLEGKVKERTLELEQTNEELSTTLTDLKETQSQLVDAEKMASLGQLTAGIAHEINNPINFVVSNVNPLKRDIQDIMEVLTKYADIEDETGLNEKLQEIRELKEDLDLDFVIEEINMLLKGIDDGANRTAEIVKSLRTFSRLDETDLKQADINEGLDSTLLLLNNSLHDNIEIVKEYDEMDPIECYAGKLNQLFMNILKNAMQAIEAKQFAENVRPTISLVTKNETNHITIIIRDNGIGMDEATMGRAFEPFFTTKDVGEGTGLGLSIAYNIVEKHKGTIRVKSESGVGTEFTVTIPKRQPDSNDAKDRMSSKDKMKEDRRSRLIENNKPISYEHK